MASAFIIRPFGTKNGIDFERVDQELIDPALEGHKLAGRTTGDTLKQGNIRTEMFRRLLTADLLLADFLAERVEEHASAEHARRAQALYPRGRVRKKTY